MDDAMGEHVNLIGTCARQTGHNRKYFADTLLLIRLRGQSQKLTFGPFNSGPVCQLCKVCILCMTLV